jgi:hypothetical protein
MRNGSIKDIYFFQDNGYIMRYEIAKRQKTQHKLFDVSPNENWKMITRTVEYSTKSAILYDHKKCLMKVYDL